jgi:microcystin-dependent protein
MPTTYTTNKRLATQAATENSGVWGAGGTTGDDLNTGVMGLVDTQLAGVATFSVSSSNVSLSYANVQSAMFRFTGTLLANIVVSPAVGDATTYFNGFYYWENLTSGSFSITVTTANGSVVLPQSRRGVLFVSATATLAPRIVAIAGSATADPIPTGARTLFYNTSAPAAWTAFAMNDYAVKVVTTGSGGVLSGSVAYSTLFARTATDAHTLTTAQIPLHGHPYRVTTGADTDAGGLGGFAMDQDDMANRSAFSGTPSSASGEQIGGTGGGASHTHDLDMRVLTAAFTLATKD